MCVPSDRSQNYQRWEIGGSRRGISAYLCVYVCDCCVNQSLRSEVPTSKRKMGQTASVELAELTVCVIDPPQNVLKESEPKEAEMLPERGALRLKETSEMPSKR